MDPEQYALMARVEDSHWWYVGMQCLAAALLDREDALRAELRVLDAGCGTGGTTAWLARYGAVVGVDIAAEAVPFWRPRGLTRVARGSVDALPFASGAFDLVTCFDVLYHQQVTHEATVLAEFWRVLRPGGWLLLRVPAYAWLHGAHDDAVHTRRRYTRGDITGAVRAAGFSVAVATYGNAVLFPLAAAKRLSERWLGPSQAEMSLPPRLVNSAFTIALRAEARVLRRWSLPWGLSALVLGRKSMARTAGSPRLAVAS
jgi:SAM-dependent methyltransferase